MAFFQKLDEKLKTFIESQKLFFTASAPNQGRVNLSPKGLDTFRILDDHSVCYLDLTGSGNETAAHIRENGRLTLMFCSFSERPLILRLYGNGEVIGQKDADWQPLVPLFAALPGSRQIIRMHIESIQTSCGFGVPIFDFRENRGTLIRWAQKKGEDGLHEYWHKSNRRSIDGLPTGLE